MKRVQTRGLQGEDLEARLAQRGRANDTDLSYTSWLRIAAGLVLVYLLSGVADL
jgi:hypothetical protein